MEELWLNSVLSTLTLDFVWWVFFYNNFSWHCLSVKDDFKDLLKDKNSKHSLSVDLAQLDKKVVYEAFLLF